MKNELIENYQEIIAKIYVGALKSLNRKVGREIFISMLKGRKDSKIVKGNYYKNEYYGIFASFRGNEISDILDYLIKEGIIETENHGTTVLIYTKKTINELYKYYYNFIKYISDSSINIIDEKDETLFRKLKDIRYAISVKENLSAYNICSDKILREMCWLKPKTKEELYKIYGIGEKFIERYSEDFLKILKE